MTTAGNSTDSCGRRSAATTAWLSIRNRVPSTIRKIVAGISGCASSARAGKANPSSTPSASNVGPRPIRRDSEGGMRAVHPVRCRH